MNRRHAGVLIVLVAWLAAVAVVVGADVRPASACSCIRITDDEAYVRASVVFVGDLVDSGSAATPGGGKRSNDPRPLTFAVSAVHKGEASERQVVVTAREGGSCGLELAAEGPYLVFAAPGDTTARGVGADVLGANLCNGTRALGSNGIPASFGPARPPSPGASTGPTSPGDDWDMRPFAALVGTALIASIAWIFLRRHRG